MNEYQCPNCEQWNVTRTIERDFFAYRSPSRGVIRLNYTAPMYVCPDCGLKFTDEAGEDARAQSVREYLRGGRNSDDAD